MQSFQVPLDYSGTQQGRTTRVDTSQPSPVAKLRKPYRIALEKGMDGWIVVTSPDLDELVTQGKTENEAIANAMDAIELILEEKGQEKEFNLIINRKI